MICLDVLRAMQREPQTVARFLTRCDWRGAPTEDSTRSRTNWSVVSYTVRTSTLPRRVIEMMAFALQAALLRRHSTLSIAGAFCATRIDGDWGGAFGTLPIGLDTQGRARGSRKPDPQRPRTGRFLSLATRWRRQRVEA